MALVVRFLLLTAFYVVSCQDYAPFEYQTEDDSAPAANPRWQPGQQYGHLQAPVGEQSFRSYQPNPPQGVPSVPGQPIPPVNSPSQPEQGEAEEPNGAEGAEERARRRRLRPTRRRRQRPRQRKRRPRPRQRASYPDEDKDSAATSKYLQTIGAQPLLFLLIGQFPPQNSLAEHPAAGGRSEIPEGIEVDQKDPAPQAPEQKPPPQALPPKPSDPHQSQNQIQPPIGKSPHNPQQPSLDAIQPTAAGPRH